MKCRTEYAWENSSKGLHLESASEAHICTEDGSDSVDAFLEFLQEKMSIVYRSWPLYQPFH